MLGGGEDIHAVLAHGAESGGHHVRFCLWVIIGSVHLVFCLLAKGLLCGPLG
jgi:hypothetical protein